MNKQEINNWNNINSLEEMTKDYLDTYPLDLTEERKAEFIGDVAQHIYFTGIQYSLVVQVTKELAEEQHLHFI